jgi:hypothetical protein
MKLLGRSVATGIQFRQTIKPTQQSRASYRYFAIRYRNRLSIFSRQAAELIIIVDCSPVSIPANQ